MNFHGDIHEFSCIRIKKNIIKFKSFIHEISGGTSWNFHEKNITNKKKKKKKVHEIPGGTSWNYHEIFFDPELRKI